MARDISSNIKRKKVDFILEAPQAKEVYVAGSFNDWSLKTHPMKRVGNGTWKKTTMLPVGSYEYKFWADGRWLEDPQNERRCVNGFGSINNIVNICG